MESLEILKKWTKMAGGKEGVHYYTRAMQGGRACIKPYVSHIFICQYQTQNEMKCGWGKVNHYIALKYQSQLETVIEKSNFYLCVFVAEKVDMEIKNGVEGDSFCAKKYVFDENHKELKECLVDIENKIFRLNLKMPLLNKPLKLESLELQNFRGYAGNVTIDFRDCRSKAASFAVIYAKNGVGKTSLFDGVEFALKGEVGRIVELGKKDKLLGPIYHNYDNLNKKAFVKMNLDQEEPIERKVAEIAEGGNDCRILPASSGRKITGLKDGNKLWNRIILPHDKIDSFISAHSQEDQYKEWTSVAEPLKDETKDFENTHKLYKEAENRLVKLNDGYKSIEDKLEQLLEMKTTVSRLIELVSLYNNIAEEGRILEFPQEGASVEQYDAMVNQARKYSRQSEMEKEGVESKIAKAEDILNTGISFYREALDSIDRMKRALSNSELRIERRKKLDILMETDNRNQNMIEQYQKEIEFLQGIVNYGIEKVKDRCKEFCSFEKRISDLEQANEYFENEYQKTIGENEKAKLKKEECEASILTEEEYQEALGKTVEFEQLDEMLQEMQKECAIAEEQSKQKKEMIKQQLELLGEISQFYLPKMLSELKVKDILKVDIVLDIEMQKQLYVFEEKYRDISIQLRISQKELERQEASSKELDDIRRRGREYLNKHKDAKECPLCNTSFSDWETLFWRMNHVQNENDEALKQRLRKNKEDMKVISEKYETFCLECEKVRDEKFKSHQEKLAKLERENTYYMESKGKKEKQKEEVNEKKNELKIWFLQKNICLDKISSTELAVWREKQLKRLSSWKEKLDEFDKKKKTARVAVNNMREALENARLQKNQIVNNTELYSYISFFKKQTEEIDCSAQMLEKGNLLKECEKQRQMLRRQIEEYRDMSHIDLEACIKARNVYLRELRELEEMKKGVSIFKDFSEEGVTESLAHWGRKKKCCEEQNEYLKQIFEESSARHYFENYRKYCKELEEKKKECLEQVEEKERLQQKFIEKKKILEEGLKAYFNQSIMNEIYRKIDAHDIMKDVDYQLSFNEKDEAQLCIQAFGDKEGETKTYRPEWYFSTAQLNTVAFSSFFSRALTANNLEFRTIFIDDPIAHFDDMNILGFTDLIRSILEMNDCQIIMSTHNEKIFRILERKLDAEYYSSCFIRLPEGEAVTWKR